MLAPNELRAFQMRHSAVHSHAEPAVLKIAEFGLPLYQALFSTSSLSDVLQKLHELKHPVVSISFKAEDIDLPLFYICPSPTVPDFDEIILYGFVANCQFISKDSPPGDSNATAPLDWDVDRTPDRTFEKILSNCPVHTRSLPNLGLCFGFDLTGYTVKKEEYIGSTVILSVAFAYRSPPTDPLFPRTFWLLSSFSAQPLQNQTTSVGARFSQELPLSQQSQLTLALTDNVHVNGHKDRTGVGESIYFLPFSDPTFFYPGTLAEIAFVKMRFDSRGIYVVAAKSPWNWSEFVTLQNTLYTFAIVAFGCAYGILNERRATKRWMHFRKLQWSISSRVWRRGNSASNQGVELITSDPEK